MESKQLVRLIPVVPNQNLKYSRRVDQRLGPQLVNLPFSGDRQHLINSERHLAVEWKCFTTPEGDSYWSDDQRKIVTHTDPNRCGVSALISNAYETVLSRTSDWENLEVFFNLSRKTPETPLTAALEYYVVNHATRGIFWIEDVTTDKIGMGYVQSLDELKSALLPEYWIHIDYFPCHRVVGNEATEELSNVLRHGAVDDMTAPGSTFPYSSHECRQYLTFIEGFRRSSASLNPLDRAYETASIARIWSSIARVRHINGYGSQGPRLDRLQGLEDYIYTQSHRSFILSIVELACFCISRPLFARLTALWNGRIVYQRHWHVLFDELRREWKLLALIDALLTIANIITLTMSPNNATLLKIFGISVTAGAVALSILLRQAHLQSGLATAGDISTYISHAENSRVGVRGLSILLSLPRALTIWGTIVLCTSLITDAIHWEYMESWVIATMATGIVMLIILSAFFFARPTL